MGPAKFSIQLAKSNITIGVVEALNIENGISNAENLLSCCTTQSKSIFGLIDFHSLAL